jgi:hypothetical protein
MPFYMGCPALGVWVAFLKQPDALPGRAPPKNILYILKNNKYIFELLLIYFLCFINDVFFGF